MTHEEKDLMIKDLYARVPYGVKVQDMEYNLDPVTPGILDRWHGEVKLYGDENYRPIEKVRAYLRPFSSLSDEELAEYHLQCGLFNYNGASTYYDTPNSLKWLLANHVDFNRLIPMGLALEAKKEMYNTVNK